MAGHTEGPWVVFNSEQIAPADARLGDPAVAIMAVREEEEQKANARLIAAAPSLYEAAHMVLQANDAERPHLMWAAVEALRSAFREARGEESNDS